MLEIYVIFFTLFLTLISNYISKKKQFLTYNKFNIHKSFASKSYLPITVGFIFLTSCLLFLYFENYYKLPSIDKSLNVISKYKVNELKEIAIINEISIDGNKKDIYEKLKNEITPLINL